VLPLRKIITHIKSCGTNDLGFHPADLRLAFAPTLRRGAEFVGNPLRKTELHRPGDLAQRPIISSSVRCLDLSTSEDLVQL